MNHAIMSLGSNLLLMTCRVRVEAADAAEVIALRIIDRMRL